MRARIPFVGVGADAARGHGERLGQHIRDQLLLRRRALDIEVHAHLVLRKADKLARDLRFVRACIGVCVSVWTEMSCISYHTRHIHEHKYIDPAQPIDAYQAPFIRTLMSMAMKMYTHGLFESVC